MFYQSETLTEEDNILPDAVEMSTSGFVSVDRTLENGVAGAEIKFVFQFKINVAQSAVIFLAMCGLQCFTLFSRISSKHSLRVYAFGSTILLMLLLEIPLSTPVLRSRFGFS